MIGEWATPVRSNETLPASSDSREQAIVKHGVSQYGYLHQMEIHVVAS